MAQRRILRRRVGFIIPVTVVLFAASTLLPAFNAAAGNVYYVALTGSDLNPGTQGLPWRTISKAVTVAKPGDTVYVRGGTYAEQVHFITSGIERQAVTSVILSEGNKATFDRNLSNIQAGDYLYVYLSWESNSGVYRIAEIGSNYVRVEGAPFLDEAGKVQASIATPIVFRNYPGETVTVNPNGRSYALRFGTWATRGSGANYIIVDGISATRSDEVGVGLHYSSHNVIRNAMIYANDAPGVGIWFESQYNIIENCEIYDNGWNQPGEGVYIGNANEVQGCDYNHVISNYIHHCKSGDEGTDLKQGVLYTVIEGNVYENNPSPWGVVIIGRGFDGVPSSHSLVYGNTFRNNSGSDQWAGCIQVAGPDNAIFNNVIHRNTGLDGIYLVGWPGNRLHNNTIYGMDVGIGMEGNNSGTEIKNNILSRNGKQISGSTGGVGITHNLFDGASDSYGENAVRGDPQFANPIAGDFHLTSGSMAIDAGVSVDVAVDFDLESRHQGAAPDIGAYEYPQYAEPTVTPPPPTAMPTNTVMPQPTPTIQMPTSTPAPLPGLSWEAEDGVIFPPFTVSNGTVFQSTWTDDPVAGGKASYRFVVTEPGDYVVNAVVDAPDLGRNSFHVNIDGEPTTPIMIWDIPITRGTEKRPASWRGRGSEDNNEFVPRVFALTAGEHELIVRGREGETRIDRISLEPFVPPTATPTVTPVPPTPTETSLPPTDTPTVTPVPPTPTETLLPPTDTPTVTPVPPEALPTSTPTVAPEPRGGDVTIYGKVYDALAGYDTGIVGARVSLAKCLPGNPRTDTDADGNYSLIVSSPELEACFQIMLQVKASGYSSLSVVIPAPGLRTEPRRDIALMPKAKWEPQALGDVNGDQVVNLFDLVVVSSAYDPEGLAPSSAADVNGDGVVDLFDLVGVSSNYGATYP